jgi:hypothetical protein
MDSIDNDNDNDNYNDNISFENITRITYIPRSERQPELNPIWVMMIVILLIVAFLLILVITVYIQQKIKDFIRNCRVSVPEPDFKDLEIVIISLDTTEIYI